MRHSIHLFQVVMGLTEGTRKKMMKEELQESSFTCMIRTQMRPRCDSQLSWPRGQFGPFRCVLMSSSLFSSLADLPSLTLAAFLLLLPRWMER